MAWKPKEYCWYKSGHLLCRIITTLLFWPTVRGKEHIPRSGAVIIAPTHRSFLDIPVLGNTTWRPMRFMAKKELFKNAFVSWYFHTNGSFSVDKDSGDAAAVRKAVSILKANDALVVFPEGKRNKGSEVGELATGVGFLAVKGQAPVIPVGIVGVDKPIRFKYGCIPVFARPKVMVGEAITSHINAEGKTSEISAQLLEELRARLNELSETATTIEKG